MRVPLSWLREYVEDVLRQRRTEVLLAAEHDDALDDVETQDRVFDRIRESSAENIEELITRVRAFLESEDSNPRH